MTINFSFRLSPLNSPPKLHTCKPQLILSLSECLPMSCHYNSQKTEFLLIGLPAQLPKISNPSRLMPSYAIITPTPTARNLGVIFDSTLSMSDHISYVSKSCFLSNRDLRKIWNTLDHTTAPTIVTFSIQFKLDYCNSLFLNLPQSQLNRLQLILNAYARAVSKSPKILPHQSSSQVSSLAGKFNSALYIKSYLSPTKLFSLVNLLISTATSLCNPTVLLAPLTPLPCNVHQFAQVSK